MVSKLNEQKEKIKCEKCGKEVKPYVYHTSNGIYESFECCGISIKLNFFPNKEVQEYNERKKNVKQC